MTVTLERPAIDTETAPKATTVLLLGAPLLMAAARVLLVPMDDQDWNKTMSHMAAHSARSNLGWFLAMAACGLLAVTTFGLASRLQSAGRTRAAVTAMVTTGVGWAGCAAVCLAGLYLSAAAAAPDRAVQVQLQKDFNNGSAAFPFLLSILGVIGYVVLAVALARSKQATKGAAVLIGIGGAATLMTMAGPLTPLLVLTALLLAAGHALVIKR